MPVDADPPEVVAAVVEDFLVRHDKFPVRNESDLIHPLAQRVHSLAAIPVALYGFYSFACVQVISGS